MVRKEEIKQINHRLNALVGQMMQSGGAKRLRLQKEISRLQSLREQLSGGSDLRFLSRTKETEEPEENPSFMKNKPLYGLWEESTTRPIRHKFYHFDRSKRQIQNYIKAYREHPTLPHKKFYIETYTRPDLMLIGTPLEKEYLLFKQSEARRNPKRNAYVKQSGKRWSVHHGLHGGELHTHKTEGKARKIMHKLHRKNQPMARHRGTRAKRRLEKNPRPYHEALRREMNKTYRQKPAKQPVSYDFHVVAGHVYRSNWPWIVVGRKAVGRTYTDQQFIKGFNDESNAIAFVQKIETYSNRKKDSLIKKGSPVERIASNPRRSVRRNHAGHHPRSTVYEFIGKLGGTGPRRVLSRHSGTFTSAVKQASRLASTTRTPLEITHFDRLLAKATPNGKVVAV